MPACLSQQRHRKERDRYQQHRKLNDPLDCHFLSPIDLSGRNCNQPTLNDQSLAANEITDRKSVMGRAGHP
jgi:hypothetical protein